MGSSSRTSCQVLGRFCHSKRAEAWDFPAFPAHMTSNTLDNVSSLNVPVCEVVGMRMSHVAKQRALRRLPSAVRQLTKNSMGLLSHTSVKQFLNVPSKFIGRILQLAVTNNSSEKPWTARHAILQKSHRKQALVSISCGRNFPENWKLLGCSIKLSQPLWNCYSVFYLHSIIKNLNVTKNARHIS